MTTPWRIELFGRLRATYRDRSITQFESRKTGLLLACLALYARQDHSREALAERLWEEVDLTVGRNRLKQALASLRRQLEPPDLPSGSVLVADRFTLHLNPQAFTSDVAEFEALLKIAERTADPPEKLRILLAAAELYTGDLLPDQYEEWVLLERERLAQRHLNVLSEILRFQQQLGEPERAIETAHSLIAIDPLREETYLALLPLYVETGRPEEALRRFRDLEARLERDLNDHPSEALRDLAERIEQGDFPQETCLTPRQTHEAKRLISVKHSVQSAGQSGPSSRLSLPAPLPMRLTRFFGREEEMSRLQHSFLPELDTVYSDNSLRDRLLASPAQLSMSPPPYPLSWEGGGAPFVSRLVTLVGPGGAGKTRLAIEFAAHVATNACLDVWFVPLADLTDGSRVPVAIAIALRLELEANGDALERVTTFLNSRMSGLDRRALLVLDNFEQLPKEAAGVVYELLEHCPALLCLVTSRHAMNIEGEIEFDIAPLPTPGLSDTPHELWHYSSVRLFTDRAQAVRADFQVTAHNAASVASLCRRLDGIPLALELAAAWAQSLTPAQMLDRLAQRSDLLTRRHKNSPERHRTLHSTIDWSYRLLTPSQQRLFTALSLFRGGWSLEAAEKIRVDGEESNGKSERENSQTGSSSKNTPPDLSEDVADSMLEQLTQLRERSLIVTEEQEGQIRFRMLETLRDFAAAELSTAQREEWSRRHALYFTLFAEEYTLQIGSAANRSVFQKLEADYQNILAALSWCEQHQEVETGLRLAGAMGRYWHQNHLQGQGEQWLNQLLLHRKRASLPVRGKALSWAGYLTSLNGDKALAGERFAEALEIQRAIGDPQGLAETLNGMGIVAFHNNDPDAARSYWHESLSLLRELGNMKYVARLLHNLGMGCELAGDLEGALRYAEESLAACKTLGLTDSLLHCYEQLSKILAMTGDLDRARAIYNEAIRMAHVMGYDRSLPLIIRRFADILSQATIDEAEAVACLYGASETLLKSLVPPLEIGPEAETGAAAILRLTQNLGTARFNAAWQRGQAMSRDEVIEFACARINS